MAGDNDSEITGFNYDVGEITKVMYTLNNGVFGDFNNVLTDFYDAKPILFEVSNVTTNFWKFTTLPHLSPFYYFKCYSLPYPV